MIKKKLVILFVLFFSYKVCAQTKSDVQIIIKIDNEIITNVDIKNEINYLIAINNKLKDVNHNEIKKFAIESLKREVIKKKELLKYYTLNNENDYLNKYIENFYKKLKISTEEEFMTYLSEYNLKIEDVKKKLEIEVVWNEFIFTKYKDQINIDIDGIKKKINDRKVVGTSYLLSEILFEVKNKEEINSKYKKIIKNINELGFENTANIYSISETSKYGGEIGWISEANLSKKINDKLKNLDKGEVSDKIIVQNGILILKINDKKKENIDFNKEDEINKVIAYEKNKQFSGYSIIYYNKLRFNAEINEG